MKPTLLITAAVLAGALTGARGQTWLQFANTDATPVTNALTGQPLAAGNGFRAALYFAPDYGETDPDRLTLLATTANFPTAGHYDGGWVTVPGVAEQGYRTFQVRVWEASYGATWDDASRAPARNGRRALRGSTPPLSVWVQPGFNLPDLLSLYGVRLLSVAVGGPASTINVTNSFAAGANIGWLDWHPSDEHGVILDEYVCSGHIHGANVGWINLGDGSPADGIRYRNIAGDDYGVNIAGGGRLRGLAWGANIGWLNFEDQGDPKIDLLTGRFSGHVWGANVGWISLSNTMAYVQTDRFAPATDRDGDGIPDAWEIQYSGGLATFTGTSDADGDGVSDLNEYYAGTLPLDPGSKLVAEISTVSGVGPSPMVVSWTGVPGRVYGVDLRDSLAADWVDSGLRADPSRISGVGPSPMRAVFGVGPSPMRLFRVVAMPPLSP